MASLVSISRMSNGQRRLCGYLPAALGEICKVRHIRVPDAHPHPAGVGDQPRLGQRHALLDASSRNQAINDVPSSDPSPARSATPHSRAIARAPRSRTLRTRRSLHKTMAAQSVARGLVGGAPCAMPEVGPSACLELHGAASVAPCGMAAARLATARKRSSRSRPRALGLWSRRGRVRRTTRRWSAQIGIAREGEATAQCSSPSGAAARQGEAAGHGVERETPSPPSDAVLEDAEHLERCCR